MVTREIEIGKCNTFKEINFPNIRKNVCPYIVIGYEYKYLQILLTLTFVGRVLRPVRTISHHFIYFLVICDMQSGTKDAEEDLLKKEKRKGVLTDHYIHLPKSQTE